MPSSACAAALLGGGHTNRRLPFIRPFYIRDALLLGARSICLHISKSERRRRGDRGGQRHTEWKKMETERVVKQKREKSGREIRGTVELQKQRKLIVEWQTESE